jgi:hypothetical protein
VIEEPAHAAAATARAAAVVVAAVEAEGVTAVMLVAMTAPVAAVVMVSSKHFVLDPISLYRNDRYIGLEIRQERISDISDCAEPWRLGDA